MKKLSLILLVIVLFLTGCGKSTPTNTNTTTEKSEVYTFEYKGISIPMHAEAAPIIEKLGKAMDVFETDSCAFQGKEKTYTYSGFELHTYEQDKKDYVAAVVFLDDSVKTKEGISISSKLSDVKKAYGDSFKEDMGLVTYQKDKMKISFVIEKDEVTSVEYNALAK
jgi:hypothetical protein